MSFYIFMYSDGVLIHGLVPKTVIDLQIKVHICLLNPKFRGDTRYFLVADETNKPQPTRLYYTNNL